MSILISEIETDLYRHYFIQRQVCVHVTPSWGTKQVHTARYATCFVSKPKNIYRILIMLLGSSKLKYCSRLRVDLTPGCQAEAENVLSGKWHTGTY